MTAATIAGIATAASVANDAVEAVASAAVPRLRDAAGTGGDAFAFGRVLARETQAARPSAASDAAREPRAPRPTGASEPADRPTDEDARAERARTDRRHAAAGTSAMGHADRAGAREIADDSGRALSTDGSDAGDRATGGKAGAASRDDGAGTAEGGAGDSSTNGDTPAGHRKHVQGVTRVASADDGATSPTAAQAAAGAPSMAPSTATGPAAPNATTPGSATGSATSLVGGDASGATPLGVPGVTGPERTATTAPAATGRAFAGDADANASATPASGRGVGPTASATATDATSTAAAAGAAGAADPAVQRDGRGRLGATTRGEAAPTKGGDLAVGSPSANALPSSATDVARSRSSIARITAAGMGAPVDEHRPDAVKPPAPSTSTGHVATAGLAPDGALAAIAGARGAGGPASAVGTQSASAVTTTALAADRIALEAIDRITTTVTAGVPGLESRIEDPELGTIRIVVSARLGETIRAEIVARDPAAARELASGIDRALAAGANLPGNVDLRVRAEVAVPTARADAHLGSGTGGPGAQDHRPAGAFADAGGQGPGHDAQPGGPSHAPAPTPAPGRHRGASPVPSAVPLSSGSAHPGSALDVRA